MIESLAVAVWVLVVIGAPGLVSWVYLGLRDERERRAEEVRRALRGYVVPTEVEL